MDWSDYVYISTNTTVGCSDILLVSESASSYTPLDVGASYTMTVNATIPEDIIGSQYLLFVANGSAEELEGIIANNIIAVPIELLGPNLEVSDVTVPLIVLPGEKVTVSWTVTNQGFTTALSGWQDRIYVSEDDIFDFDTKIVEEWILDQTPLEAGQSYTVTRQITIPGDITGTRYLLFVTDYYNHQLEGNEDDNVYALQFSLNVPDLVLLNNATAPATGIVGQTIDIFWQVTNQGGFDALADWYDAVFISGNTTYEVGVDTLVAEYDMSLNSPLSTGVSYGVNKDVFMPSVAAGSLYL